MGLEDDQKEIFRRLETNDSQIVDLHKEMIGVRRDVDEKFNIINQNILKIVGDRGDNSKNVISVPKNGGSEGIKIFAIAGLVVTLLGQNIAYIYGALRYHEEQPAHPTALSRHTQVAAQIANFEKDIDGLSSDIEKIWEKGFDHHNQAGHQGTSTFSHILDRKIRENNANINKRLDVIEQEIKSKTMGNL